MVNDLTGQTGLFTLASLRLCVFALNLDCSASDGLNSNVPVQRASAAWGLCAREGQAAAHSLRWTILAGGKPLNQVAEALL